MGLAVLTGPILRVPGTKICYRNSEADGWLVSWDGGEIWNFQRRSLAEILDMHPSIVTSNQKETQDRERELFGETLDDPIPDDLWEMLSCRP